jgi:hypothetical protein
VGISDGMVGTFKKEILVTGLQDDAGGTLGHGFFDRSAGTGERSV